jgi:hypothetical protein
MTDDELHHQMRRARPNFDFSPDFQREIWGRIEATENTAPAYRLGSLWAGLLRWLARPVPAVGLAVVMGSAGCLLAVVREPKTDRNVAEAIYLKSVSPFAAAKLSDDR